MKTKTVYECEYCKKKSENPEEILLCEAKHLGIHGKLVDGKEDERGIIESYNAYNALWSLAKYCKFLVEKRNRKDAMPLYIRTANDIIQFEKENGIESDIRYSNRKEIKKVLMIESAPVNIMGTTRYYENGVEVSTVTGFGYKDENDHINWYNDYDPGTDDEFHFTEIEGVS